MAKKIRSDLDFRVEIEEEKGPVETSQMVRMAKLTLAAIPDSGLVVWCGLSRVGKTTTARWMTKRANAAFDDNDPKSFRALHYETGSIRPSSRDELQALRSLYAQVVRVPMTQYEYMRRSTESHAEQIVRGLMRRRIRLVFIDEAGKLSLGAMNGIVLARDTAENMGWPVSFVLIGMDDLAPKMEKQPQIAGRIHRWCYFEEYNLDETKKLLAGLHAHFSGEWTSALDDEAAFIHEQCRGFPGDIAYFLRQLDLMVGARNVEIDLQWMKATRAIALSDRNRSMRDAASHHAKTPKSVATKEARKAAAS